MTQYEEWEAVSQRFGVDMEQVRRDHLISRLSEDIDLIAVARRTHLRPLAVSQRPSPRWALLR